jgi:RimJ/RimL family protein N-acetyltransferase
MPSAVELRDAELLLRPWQDGDADEVGCGPGDDGEVGRFFGRPYDGGWPEPDPDAPVFAIVDGARVVGRIWFAAQKRPFEVGYFLHPGVWGRGLATRALVLVRDWLSEPIVLCTHPLNVRSQRVAERAGFRPDGVVENYARFKDGETAALRYVYP